MLAQLPTLIVRFDINKVSSAAYGFYCWKILCKAVELAQVRSSLLFDGDSSETLHGHENVFCIAFQTLFPEQLTTLQSKLSKDAEFLQFCAASPFLEGPRAHQEPLVAAGRIDAEGRLSEDADSAKEAMAALKNLMG
jgi:hypothetical protein